VTKARAAEPDDQYPKLPETDYHHDQGTNPGTKSPGPFHGDDLVTQQNSGEDVHNGGRIVDSYMYPDGEHTEDSKRVQKQLRIDAAVDVVVVDTVVKTQRITNMVHSPMLIQPGEFKRVVSKDPTRNKLYLQANVVGAYLTNPDTAVNPLIATAVQFGFPVSTTQPLVMDTEEEMWAFCSSDVTAPGVYIAIMSEYVRSTDTLEEYYNG
jgi:hypothetical protein